MSGRQPRRVPRRIAVWLTLVAATLAPTAAARGEDRLPVPYTLVPGIADAVLHPGSPPAGANDWSCKPTAAHPEPVVLVHGLVENMTDIWPAMSPLLHNHCYCVFALTYGNRTDVPFPLDQLGGVNAIERSARTLAAFVKRVRAATGAARVDIVAHSEGTVMSAYYVKFLRGARRVRRLVGIAAIYHGTNVGGLARLEPFARRLGVTAPFDEYCPACIQLLDNSPFIAKLNRGRLGAAVRRVAYTNILTRYDELVVPYTSGMLDAPNATNIVLQDGCKLDLSDHFSIVAERNTAQHMLNALDPANARPVSCVPVLPLIG